MARPLNILFLSSEAEPFAKKGGLADVAGALPLTIKSMGHEIRLMMPRYGTINERRQKLHEMIRVVLASRIAAGDETAFCGTRRLGLDRDLYRQRVGREHRLVFRMHAQELEAVDLVPRKDLERTIRELSRG